MNVSTTLPRISCETWIFNLFFSGFSILRVNIEGELLGNTWTWKEGNFNVNELHQRPNTKKNEIIVFICIDKG